MADVFRTNHSASYFSTKTVLNLQNFRGYSSPSRTAEMAATIKINFQELFRRKFLDSALGRCTS
jgi:hypothetical protein